MRMIAIMIVNASPRRLAAVFSSDCSASSLEGPGIEKIKSNSTVKSWSIIRQVHGVIVISYKFRCTS